MAHEKTKELYRKWLEQVDDNITVEFTEWLDTQPEAPVMSGKENLDLHTLEHIKFMFGLHSDNSARCNGYNNLCKIIESVKSHPPVNLLQVPTEEEKVKTIDLSILVKKDEEIELLKNERNVYLAKCLELGDQISKNKSSQPTTEKLSKENCEHNYVPIDTYEQTGKFICTKCNHKI